MKGQIKKVAFIGFRGFDYEEIELGKSELTALVGPSGAGKSTLVMCMDYALLPDRKVMDIRPLSDLQDPHNAGKDSLLARINPNYGYGYVVFDIQTRDGKRLLAGIHAYGEDGRGDLDRFYINNLPSEIDLHDAFRVMDGEEQYYPDFQELKKHLASQGVDLHTCKTVGEYGQALYDAGILPTNLSDSTDRTLYGKLIESTFRGGVSSEVASKLKDYLLPKETRVHQTVDKIQECTHQVFSTRRALEDATKQLQILQATYGTGKQIVLHTLRHEIGKKDSLKTQTQFTQQELDSSRMSLESTKKSQAGLIEEIKLTEETIESLRRNVAAELNDTEQEMDGLRTKRSEQEKEWGNAKAALGKFEKGRSEWQEVATEHSDKNVRWLEDFLGKKQKELQLKETLAEIEIDKLQQEKALLEVGSANPKTTTLAKSINGCSLEEALDEASDEESRAIELRMHGLVDGVVGASLESLENVSANEDLPELFWLGDTPLTLGDVKEIGDWHVLQHEGYSIVSSKFKKSAFGRKARLARIKSIDEEIDSQLQFKRKNNNELSIVNNHIKSIQANGELIEFYLNNKEGEEPLKDRVNQSLHVFEETTKAYAMTEEKVKRLRHNQHKATEPHQEALNNMRANQIKNQENINRLESGIPGSEAKLIEYQNKTLELDKTFERIIAVLASHSEKFLADCEGLKLEDDSSYIAQQTKRISELGKALEGELPVRQVLLQEASAISPESCVCLWPMLLDVLKDRVVIDLTDTDGSDFLKEMQGRRDDLDSRLSLQENEVRIQARSLHAAIHSSVRSQATRINALSKLGDNINFGNVVGIRINVRKHDQMLQILESFADQMDLFSSKNNTPVDEAMEEFFKMASDNYNYSGEELLDYRSYMDVAIEAKRKGGDWESASSLSGGESIGGGLALALMLSRALSSRGEIKPEQITPLFAIDEVHRLDSKGQGVIVEFAKREGFQVFVTAAALKPTYECTLYSLERIYEPEERLIIRGIERKLKDAA